MKKTAGTILIACAVCLVLALCFQASGAILVFTSRDAWTSQVNGDVDVFQDFNAINFQLSPDVAKDVAFPGFSILQDPGFAINFAGVADLFASSSTPIFLTPNSDFFGFGADFEVLDGTLQLEAVGLSGGPMTVPRTGFFGIVSDLPFNAINFSAAQSIRSPLGITADPVVNFRMDNVTLARVVPEPVSLIIWCAGFSATAGYVAIRRRLRSRCEKV